jgi:hypothetical protein
MNVSVNTCWTNPLPHVYGLRNVLKGVSTEVLAAFFRVPTAYAVLALVLRVIRDICSYNTVRHFLEFQGA